MALKKLIIAFLILSFPVFAIAAGSIAITGSINSNHSEQDIIDGNETITLNLSGGATWKLTVADDIAPWKDAFSSAGNWSVVSNALTTGNLTLVDDTTLSINLPASSGYAIWADETVTITLPDSLFATGSGLNTPSFTITNQAPVITLGGMTTGDESDILAGSGIITVNLARDNWDATLGGANAVTTGFINGINGNQNWNTVKSLLLLDNTRIVRTSATLVTITLPPSPGYVITLNETVTVSIPATSYQNGTVKAASDPTFTVDNLNPVLSLSGSATPSLQESEIIAGNFTLFYDVLYDTWQSTLASDNALSTAFLAGITGNQNWSAVSTALSYINLARTSATRITLTLPPVAAYVITTNETVTSTIPAGSYQNGTVKAASNPTFTINNVNPVVTLSGTATPSIQETNIHAGDFTVIFDVQYDRWNNTLGANNAASTAFLAGITGNRDWSAVTAQLTFAKLVRTSATRLTLTLPATPDYAITANETVSVNIPSGSFVGSAGLNYGAAFTVVNQQATTSVTWSTGLSTITEAQVRSGALTLTLGCSNNWSTDLSVLKAQFILGLDGGAGSDWNTKILPNITVSRPSSKSAVIDFPSDITFNINTAQIITYVIPGAALQTPSGALVIAASPSFSISPATTSSSISPVSINEASLDGGTIDLALSEVTFSNPVTLGISDFSLSLAPLNTTITAVTNKTSTSVRLVLGYTGDIDVSGSLQVTVLNGLTGGGTLVTNTATVVPVIEPVITMVSIPNQTYKIGDVVPVTITVQNDGGQTFTLTSGIIGGRTISGLTRISNTSYTASFTLLSGTTDYAALTDIPVSVQLQVSGRPGNLYTTAISQNNDLLDANAPVINTFQALGTAYKIGDFVQLVANTDQAGYTVSSAQTSINGVPYSSSFFELLSESGGSYFFSYQISANDNDVANPASIAGQIVFTDPAGNSSAIKNVTAVSASFSIDANAPGISLVTVADSVYIPGETMILSLNTNGTGYSLSPETFINGISQSSGRFTLNGPGPEYTLHYPVQAADAQVSAGNLPVYIVLKDAAGNKSVATTSFVNTAAIYTTKPTATISGNTSICDGGSATLYVNLTGKNNWNIVISDGAVNYTFNGIVTSPFSYIVSPHVNTSYTISTVSDNSGLSNTGSGIAIVSMKAATPVSISAIGSAYGIESDPISLSATPPGGQFSGPGVVSSSNQFHPKIAGISDSTHTILYTYTNALGCTSYDNVKVIVVEASGEIQMNSGYCYNADPFVAKAVSDHPEVNGRFQLTRISDATLIPEGSGIIDYNNNTALISPSLLTGGSNNYRLTYKYFFNDTLSLFKDFKIEYVDPPDFALPTEICINGDSINLTGFPGNGLFTGTGVFGNSSTGFWFNPSRPGAGKAQITYTVSNVNGCKNDSVKDITVNAITPVHINSLNGTYNVVHDPVLLSALPSGGVFTGPGVQSSSNKFLPGEAGLDNTPHTIMYTYSNSFGCVSNDSAIVNVVKANGSISLKSLYCYNSPPFNASAEVTNNPSVIGKFELKQKGTSVIIPEGSGIANNGNNTVTITPGILQDPIDYTLIFKYFAGDTLSLERDFKIESIEPPKISDGIPAAICENGDSITLIGNADRGKFTGTGIKRNTTGFSFHPSLSGHGVFTMTYSDSTINGCKSEVSQEILVFYVPELLFNPTDICVVSDSSGSNITFDNKTEDKDFIRYWGWNFDDVNSGKDNFSTDIIPTHNYQRSGKYNVTLSDTTINGCTDSRDIQFTFGDKPTGSFVAVNRCFTPGATTDFLSSAYSIDGIKKYYWKFHLPGRVVTDSSTSRDFHFQFETDGKYLIEHTATSNTNCSKTDSTYVTLQPTVVLKAGVPYTDNFSSDESGWSPSKISEISWKWGTPDYSNLEDESTKAWYIRRDNTSIPELSYIISPCFNLSALERPMLKMNIFRNFVGKPDAVILSYTTNNGDSWPILGYPGDGINWYSDYQTTDYEYGLNYGWTNTTGSLADAGWVESRHILDKVSSAPGSNNVQFRFEFGASKSIPDTSYEGFAINSFSIRERDRFSVLEHFTNTTNSSPVKDKAVKANATINTLYTKEELFKDFVKLEYHTRFPSANDSLNIFNRDVPGARAFYYGVTTIPYSILDGGDRTGRRFDFTDTKYEPKELDINLRSLEDPQVALSVETQTSGNDLSISVKLKALQNLAKAERALYVILYETTVYGYNPGNGELEFRNVVRNMLPDAGGTTSYQTFSAVPSDTTTLEYNFTSNISKLNKKTTRVAVYFQDEFTGEILQAALSDYSKWGVGVKPEIVYPNGLFAYPNPATDFVEISISGRIEKGSDIEIFDQLGRKVYFSTIQPEENTMILNTSAFSRGIYYLRMSSDGVPRSEVIKLAIMN